MRPGALFMAVSRLETGGVQDQEPIDCGVFAFCLAVLETATYIPRDPWH